MLDPGGIEGPQKKSAQQSIGDKMKHLVYERPFRCNI